jgi:hypothetical protein
MNALIVTIGAVLFVAFGLIIEFKPSLVEPLIKKLF